MSGIQRRQLADGTDVVWAVPLSGMGHVADEQPLPYLQRHGVELTPRFGGEERNPQSGLISLPLPYGYLATGWPWRQRLFNFPRRRSNIYWRNIFIDSTRKDGLFHFLEQLNYYETNDGYQGKSPCMIYKRVFTLSNNRIDVSDTVVFKRNIHFSELYLCPWAEFQSDGVNNKCRVQPSMKANHSYSINASSGTANWYAHKVVDAKYQKSDCLDWFYRYQIG